MRIRVGGNKSIGGQEGERRGGTGGSDTKLRRVGGRLSGVGDVLGRIRGWGRSGSRPSGLRHVGALALSTLFPPYPLRASARVSLEIALTGSFPA